MNKNRRKRIEKVVSDLFVAQQATEDILGEEQDAYDNLPDGLNESERAMAMEDAIAYLESAIESLGQAISDLNDACDT